MSCCHTSAVWFQNILFTDQDDREDSPTKSDGSEDSCDKIEWKQLGFGFGRRRSRRTEDSLQGTGDPRQSCSSPRLIESAHATSKEETQLGSPIRSFNPYPARPGRLAAWKPESPFATPAQAQNLSPEHHSTLVDSGYNQFVDCPEDPEARLARWLSGDTPLSSSTGTSIACHFYDHRRRHTNVEDWDTDYSESLDLDYLPGSPQKSNASSISIEVLEELARCSCSNYFEGDFISSPHADSKKGNKSGEGEELYTAVREGLNPVGESCESPRAAFASAKSDVFSNSLRRTMKKDRLWEDIVGGLRRENDWLKQQMLGMQTTLEHTRKDLIAAQEHLEKERNRNGELERDFKDKCRELVSLLLANQRAREEEGAPERAAPSRRPYSARMQRLEKENEVLRDLLQGEDLVDLQIKVATERWRSKRRQRNG